MWWFVVIAVPRPHDWQHKFLSKAKFDWHNSYFCWQSWNLNQPRNWCEMQTAPHSSLTKNTLSQKVNRISDYIQPLAVYLSDLLCVYSPSRQLGSSSDSRTLSIPHTKTKTFGLRSLTHTAPVWNALPHEIRHISQPLHLKLPWRLICSNPTSPN